MNLASVIGRSTDGGSLILDLILCMRASSIIVFTSSIIMLYVYLKILLYTHIEELILSIQHSYRETM